MGKEQKKKPAKVLDQRNVDLIALIDLRHRAPPVTRSEKEKPDAIVTTIRYPRYIARLMTQWLHDNPGHTKTSLILNGLRAMGLPVDDEDLLPQRPRGGAP